MTFSLRRHSSLHFLSPLFIDGKCTMVCVGLCLIFISRPSGFGSLLWLADVCHLFTLSERSAGKDEVVIKAGRSGGGHAGGFCAGTLPLSCVSRASARLLRRTVPTVTQIKSLREVQLFDSIMWSEAIRTKVLTHWAILLTHVRFLTKKGKSPCLLLEKYLVFTQK